MPALSNSDFASQLAPVIAQIGSGQLQGAAAAAALANLLNQWASTTSVASAVTAQNALVQQLLTQFLALAIKGTVDTASNLPTTAGAGAVPGAAYVALDTGHGYGYVDGNWVDIGALRGVAGVDGQTLIPSTGAPPAGVGQDGDYAIDSVAGVLYGPKANGAWPAGISIIGPQGAQGFAMRSGAGAPGPSTTAVDGDFYIDVVAKVLYGPRAAGAWPAGVSITSLALASAAMAIAGTDTASAVTPAALAAALIAALTLKSGPADDGPLYYGLSADAAGQLATWLTATGAFDFAALGPSGQAILTTLIQAIVAAILTLPSTGSADDGPFGSAIISDAAGQMLVWLTGLGALDFAALGPSAQALVLTLARAAISGALTLAPPGVADDGPYGYAIVTDLTGQLLIWLDLTGALQTAGSSSSVAVRGGISYSDAWSTTSHVHFTPTGASADRGGRMPKVYQSKAGLLATSMLEARTPLEIVLYIGQSQAGTGPTPAVELRALYPYYAYALSPGSTLANNDVQGGAAFDGTVATDLVTLQDTPVGNLPCTALIANLTQLNADMLRDDPGYVAATAQQNGQSLDKFLPSAGQYNFENAIALVTGIKRVALGVYNRPIVVRTIVLNQGENGGGAESWTAAYNTWAPTIIAAVMAATGQTFRPKILLTITSNNYNSLGVTQEQIAVARVQADTVLGDPTYCYPVNPADSLHVTATGKQMQGGADADIKRRIDTGLGYTALQPDPANPPTIAGKVITIPFVGSYSSLSWDTNWVPSVANYGFSYTDTSRPPPTISSAAIVGRAVQITLSAAPTAAAGSRTVGYANTLNNPNAGTTNGTSAGGTDANGHSWTWQLGNLMTDTGISSPAYRYGQSNPTPYQLPTTIRHYAVPFLLSF